MAREISIKLKVDDSGAVTKIEQVGGAVVDLRQTAESEGPRMGRVMEEALGSMIADAAMKAMQSLQNLVRSGIRFVTQSIQDANIQAVVDQRLRQALVRAGEDGEEAFERLSAAANNLQKVTNFGNEAAQAAQAMILSFGVGADGAERLTPVMADLAAGMANASGGTMDLTSAGQLLGKALDGNLAALSRYGINLSENQEAALEAAKGMERVEMIAAILEERFGGMAEAMADPFVIAQNAIGDLRKDLGEQLLPVARDLAGVITEFVSDPAVKQGVRDIGEGLANGLRQGVDLLQTTIAFLIEYRSEIGLAASVLVRITSAVIAYRVATQAHALAARVAMIAQQGLNVAIRANPIGLIVTALTIVLPLIWRFRGQIADADAMFREFAAGVIRSVNGVIEGLQKLVSAIPNWGDTVPGVQAFRAAVAGASSVTEYLAERLEEGAASSRAYAAALREKGDATGDDTEKTRENSGAEDENADAKDKTTDSTKKLVEAQKPLPGSIAEITARLQELKTAYEGATTDEARAEIYAHIRALEEQRAALEEAARGVDAGPAAGSLEAITEAVRQLQREYERVDTQEARNEIFAKIEALNEERRAIEEATRAALGLNDVPLEGSLRAINDELRELQQRFSDVDTQQARDQIFAKIQALEAERDAIEAATYAEERRIEAEARHQESVERSIEMQLASADATIESAADIANATIASVRQVIQSALAEAIAKAIARIPFPANLVAGGFAAAAINAMFNRLVPKFAEGGLVRGKDRIIMVNDGRGDLAGEEMVMNARAVRQHYPLLAALNAGGSVRPAVARGGAERVVERVPYMAEHRWDGHELVTQFRRIDAHQSRMLGGSA